MRPAFPTAEMSAQQRSARVDQLVIDVNALQARVSSLERTVSDVTSRMTAIETFLTTGSERQTMRQRLRWLVKG